jgi:uncharacterized protein
MPGFIGREEEKRIIGGLLKSDKAELLAIYGRRRIGKTYLINQAYEKYIVFSCTGQIDGTTPTQLKNFGSQLDYYFPEKKANSNPKNWQEAFMLLRQELENKSGKGKKVIFLDEFPWLDSHRSGFLSAFGYFWNVFAANRNDLIVVICGSAASWMIRKVVHNKGGLHNRITRRIRLLPFTLGETMAFLRNKQIMVNWYQLAQLYMVTGGVPHYLNSLDKGHSIPEYIAQLCFSKDGVLFSEFQHLFPSLFTHPENHIKVAAALAKKPYGLTRTMLANTAGIQSGGSLSKTLDELEQSGFITMVKPFGKSKQDSLYRMIDEFTLFYFRFMQKAGTAQKNDWLIISQTSAYKAWCGYAFENLILRHFDQLKQAMQIGGVATSQASWYLPGKDGQEGAQIDLLIDRADNCINLCEIKFSHDVLVISKAVAENIDRKRSLFSMHTGTQKQVLITLITPKGLADTQYRPIVDAAISLEQMFPEYR